MNFPDNQDFSFHHLGIPTDQPMPGERYNARFKMFTADGTGNVRVQYHRFEADSPLHHLLKSKPHIAFKVPDLGMAVTGRKIILGPYEPIEGYKVAVIEDSGMPIELVETDLSDEVLWNKAKQNYHPAPRVAGHQN